MCPEEPGKSGANQGGGDDPEPPAQPPEESHGRVRPAELRAILDWCLASGFWHMDGHCKRKARTLLLTRSEIEEAIGRARLVEPVPPRVNPEWRDKDGGKEWSYHVAAVVDEREVHLALRLRKFGDRPFLIVFTCWLKSG